MRQSKLADPPRVPDPPVVLFHGDDDFAVKQQAKALYHRWTAELGGMDHEIIEAAVANSGEALKVVGKFREALQTLPFFGSAKVVWLRDCTFLGEDAVSAAAAVAGAVTELARELREFRWDGVRLLISAGKVDKRKAIFKTLEKIGRVECFASWSANDKDWLDRAEALVQTQIREAGKRIADRALRELVARVGPLPRQLASEVEKLCLYAGTRDEITPEDVEVICVRNKQARAFALGDALGDRDLPALLARLDDELWATKFDKDKSEIGLLYGLISKLRVLLLLKEMVREGWVRPVPRFAEFKIQLDRVPAARLPADKKYNPLAFNPYVLFKALPQINNYSTAELVRGLEGLLQANQRLVTSGLDESMVLQQVLLEIVGTGPARGRRRW